MYDIETIKKINETSPKLAKFLLVSRSNGHAPLNFRRHVRWKRVCEVLVKSIWVGGVVYVLISLFNER